MTISKVKMGEGTERLLISLERAIFQHTSHSPMNIDEIAAVVGFLAGGVVGNIKTRNARRAVREVVVSNVDMGIDAAMRMNGTKSSSIIMPENYVN